MAYDAPFATMPVESPPWHTEKAHWSSSDRYGRIISDIMLDGSGYHAGITGYNSIHETPKRLAKRLEQQKSGLTGTIVWPKDDDWEVASGRGSRLPTPWGSLPSSPQSRASTAAGSRRHPVSPGLPSSPTSPDSRATTAPGGRRQRQTTSPGKRASTAAGRNRKALSRSKTTPTLDKLFRSSLEVPVASSGDVWADSFESFFRDRDRRHKDFNYSATYEQQLDGTITRPEFGFAKPAGPAPPYSAIWDTPSTSWKATAKGNTLSPMRETITIPGV